MTKPYLVLPQVSYPFVQLDTDIGELVKVHTSLIGKVPYLLGAKPVLAHVPPDSDCSGYFAYLLSLSMRNNAEEFALYDDIGGRGTFDDAAWVTQCGFKRSSVDSAKVKDGALRVAYMLAVAGLPIGHISLVMNGVTYECHGGKGVDSRQWDGLAWQSRCQVFVLTKPTQLP